MAEGGIFSKFLDNLIDIFSPNKRRKLNYDDLTKQAICYSIFMIIDVHVNVFMCKSSKWKKRKISKNIIHLRLLEEFGVAMLVVQQSYY